MFLDNFMQFWLKSVIESRTHLKLRLKLFETIDGIQMSQPGKIYLFHHELKATVSVDTLFCLSVDTVSKWYIIAMQYYSMR